MCIYTHVYFVYFFMGLNKRICTVHIYLVPQAPKGEYEGACPLIRGLGVPQPGCTREWISLLDRLACEGARHS